MIINRKNELKKEIKSKIQKEITEINNIYNEIKDKSENEQLELFQNSGSNHTKLAVIKNLIKTHLNITPYDEQLMCAIYLTQGLAVEMRTGEGKSIASLIASLFIGSYKKIYNVTVNEYLAKRDYEKFKPIYDKLQIKVSFNPDDRAEGDKQEIHSAKVVYTSSSALIFDYLQSVLDNTEFDVESALLDEIDFILLDNANSSFSISEGAGEIDSFEVAILRKLNNIFKELKGGEITYKVLDVDESYVNDLGLDYVYVKSTRKSFISEQGEKKILEHMNLDSLTDNLIVYKSVYNLLEAYCFHIKGTHYIVEDGKIKLINQANGRKQEDSTLGYGLHNAIEAKEDIELTNSHSDSITSSYQVFFSKFKHLCGMSGTIMSDTAEFMDLYGLDTVKIPLHNKDRCIRHFPKYYKTTKEKYEALIELTKEIRAKGQPILIVCENEGSSYTISNLLSQNKITHNLLNNEFTEIETKLIEDAGKEKTITVSTNMAGRGTDIVITEEANKLGGLFVIALTNSQSIRVENQIKGRAGRQGFLGEFQLLSSLEDDIWSQLYLTEYKKISELPANEFYSKNHQKRLNKTMLNLQELYRLRDINTRKHLFYYHNIVEDIKIYLLNKYKNIGSTEEFIKETVEMNLAYHMGEFINMIQTAFQITFIEDEILEYLSKIIIYKLKYTPEIYLPLINTLNVNNVKSKWYALQEQIMEYGQTVTHGNYSRKELDRFIVGSKEIVDEFICYNSIEILNKLLTVESIEIKGK